MTGAMGTLTFLFFQFTENKMSRFRTFLLVLPVHLGITRRNFGLPTDIIKSHYFQNLFLYISDDLLILARLLPSGSLVCCPHLGRISLQPRQPVNHLAQILSLGDIDSFQYDCGHSKTVFLF